MHTSHSVHSENVRLISAHMLLSAHPLNIAQEAAPEQVKRITCSCTCTVVLASRLGMDEPLADHYHNIECVHAVPVAGT